MAQNLHFSLIWLKLKIKNGMLIYNCFNYVLCIPRSVYHYRPVVPQILADQLTLSELGRANCAYYNITGTPGFSDLPTALHS